MAEIGQIVTHTGTPLAKGSAVLVASGGLIAAIAVPAQAAPDTAEVTSTALSTQSVTTKTSGTPAAAVTAPTAVKTSSKSTASFGKIEVEPVAKPTGPTPHQLRMRAEREEAREAAAAEEQERREQAAAETQEEQEQAESAPSRSRERQAPSTSGTSTSSTSIAGTSIAGSSSASTSSSSSSSPSSTQAPSTSSASGVIGIAKQYTGTSYVFGGASPSGFDCSGFTQYVFGKAGKSLPRVTDAQQAAATPVSDPQPGDLVFFGSPAYHVGIYLGDGMMIDAPRTGSSVSVRPVFSGVSGYGRV